MTIPALGSDADLGAAVVDGAKLGDRAAFATVIRHYDPRLRALAYRLLGDRNRMDDALQEAYVNAFRGLSKHRGESSLGTWLYRIVYNACLDELRRSRRDVQLAIDEVAEWPDPRPGVDEEIPRCWDLATALGALPPEDRAAVLLVDAQGFDYREAGEVLGVPPGTIASRLNRARSRLRRVLDPEGVSER